jgi:hypothetical protein
MVTAEPVTPSRVKPLSRVRWWAYLVGCVALAAFAIGRPLLDGWREYARTHPVTPIAVAAGQEGRYADARWRLVAASVDPAAGSTRRLPPGTALLRARFTVIPGQATDLQLLRRCRVQVRDRAGRRWETYGIRLGTLPDNCGSGFDASFREITAKVGEPWTFEVGFLVPDTVVREVEPEILMPKELPRYLRFALSLNVTSIAAASRQMRSGSCSSDRVCPDMSPTTRLNGPRMTFHTSRS